MTETPPPSTGRYPSRRSLRERAAAEAERASRPAPVSRPTVASAPLVATAPPVASAPPVAPSASASASAPAVSPAAIPDPEEAPAAADPSPRTNSIRLPRRAHVPVTSIESRAPRPRRTAKQRIARASATVSVCGLVAALAFPFATAQAPEEAAAPAAAHQGLFSEVSLEDLPDSLTGVTAVEAEDDTPRLYGFRPASLVNYPFSVPVLLTDGFGYRTAPIEQFHDAQDFAAAAGTPIQAIADGTVLESEFATDGCGFNLRLEHRIDGHTVVSRYCHMIDGSNTLRPGDTVQMGEPVGQVGNTGMSFGPHLHLNIKVDGEPVDPMPFLAKYYRMERDA